MYELDDDNEEETTSSKKIRRDCSPSKDDLKATIIEQKKIIKTLQQKVRRKEKKIESLIADLKREKSISKASNAKETLDGSFNGLSLDLIQNHFINQNRDHRGRRHNEKAKKFALTLNF